VIVGGDPRGQAGRWLVEVGHAPDGGAPPYRWSTEDLVVLRADGTELEYAGGLESLDGIDADPGDHPTDGADVTITVTDPTLQWWELDPTLPCVVRRWLPGDVYERADVYARGRLADLAYGEVGDSAAWTVGPDSDEIALMLDPDARVDEVSWPTSASSEPDWEPTDYHVSGAYYPLVFGRPALFPAIAPRYTESGSYYFDPQYVISADPATFLPVEPSSADASEALWVFTDDFGAPITQSAGVPDVATVTIDGRGRPVVTLHAYSELLGSGTTVPATADATVRCQVMPGVVVGGIRSLPDVLDYVLGRWAASSVDFGRLAAVRGLLSPVMIDTWVSERVPVWEWVAHLVEYLPVRLRRGPSGLYLEEHHVTTHPSRTVRSLLVDDGDVVRVGRVHRGSEEGPYSRLTVHYADGEASGGGLDALGHLALGPEASAAGTLEPTAGQAHPLLAAAAAAGSSAHREIDCLWTWDDDTAAFVAAYQIAKDAIPHRRVDVRVPERWRLREGDQVELEDESVGISPGTLAVVDSAPTLGSDGAVLTLRIPGGLGA
jgi:hypothetical protein